MPSIPKPPKDELEALYTTQGLSVYKMAQHYNVANNTIKTWLLTDGLFDQEKATKNMLKGKAPRATAIAIPTDTETDEQNPQLDGRCGQIVKPDFIDEDSAWSRLSQKQIEAIDLLSSYHPDVVSMTQQAKADKLGIFPQTLDRWERDPDFIECLKESKKVWYITTLTDLDRADLINRYLGRDKLTDKDRERASRITGELQADVLVDQRQVHIYRDQSIKGF